MRKIIIAFILITLLSCNLIGGKKGINFKIVNKTDSSISNVKITTSEHFEKKEFGEIKPNESVSGFLSLKDNKTDGSYVLEFTRENGKKESQGYGYYTNGAPLDNSIYFEIRNDSIITKFSVY
ncbi:MAG: hypothetical protein DI598_10145 [Pseudopedobacter saltans]|uniref:Lipoprotein n=1 Tax=Pseudopedobacter saltans TaxID=151895 RepID=A0A2W5EWE3_9SPHI|nr:MAG: hypothetical protein DI598_10145 [Pseudopedobacter saltans]